MSYDIGGNPGQTQVNGVRDDAEFSGGDELRGAVLDHDGRVAGDVRVLVVSGADPGDGADWGFDVDELRHVLPAFERHIGVRGDDELCRFGVGALDHDADRVGEVTQTSMPHAPANAGKQ